MDNLNTKTEEDKAKYFFLYLRTGGGHLAPARSVAGYIERTYGSRIEPVLIDGFTGAPDYARFIVEDGYRILQSRAKWSYEVLYATHKFSGLARGNAGLVAGRVEPYLEGRILNEQPRKIVIFHFFLIKPVYDILKKHSLNIPVHIVVTDPYTAHPLWFLKKRQNYIVFSQRLKEYMLKKNVQAKSIRVFPFILDEKYSTPLPADAIPALKEKHGLDKDRKLILVAGGGDGIPKGKAIMKSLLKHGLDADIAVVCGRNKKLFSQAMELKNRFPSGRLKVFGYIDFMHEMLNMSDVVITKCGASTFMEILMTRRIPVVNDYIWEQEKGNVEFLVQTGTGIFEKNIRRLPEVINRLLTDDEYYSSFIKNIDALKLQNGTKAVAEFIVQ